MTFYLEESDMHRVVTKTLIATFLFLIVSIPAHAQSEDAFDVSPQEESIAKRVYGAPEQEALELECRTVLETAAKFIEENRKSLKPEFAKALSGAVDMNSSAPVRGHPTAQDHIKPADLDICLKVNADKQKLELLKKAIAGTLSSSPLETIQQCGAGLLVIAWAYESLHADSDAPYHLGVQIGGEIGRISTIIKFLYRGYDDLDTQGLEQAEREFGRYNQADTTTRRALLKQYAESCDNLGIPFQSYADMLPHALRPPIYADADLCYCMPGPICTYLECPMNRWAEKHNLPDNLAKLTINALLATIGIFAAVVIWHGIQRFRRK